MKGIRMIGLGLLLGLALAAAGAEKVLFSADFLRQVKPTATRTVSEEDGVQVLTIQSKTEAGNKISIPVDPALLSGKSVVFSAEVEQENVSAPPKPWNGVKVMLSLVYADGKHNYPQAPNAAGTLPWQTRSARISLPQLKSAAFTLGLEAVSGTVRFRNVQIVEVEMPDYEKRLVTGTANRKDAVYRPGEEMMFSFQILNDGKPESGKLRIIRASDDGRKETFEREVKAEAPCVVRASLNQPGFVMVKAILLDPYGTPAKRRNGRNVQYGLAGGVAADTLKQGVPEPADFDAYWKKAKEQLAAVPLRELERKVLKETAISTVYDVKVACAGNRPVSGYLSIPKGAKPGSLPLRLYFDGYSVRSAQVLESPEAVCFFVNAHGIENNREAAYYTALSRGELRGYGFRNEENQKPESCYFNNMILRDLRALEYARSLPEWNRKEVYLIGGSQGGVSDDGGGRSVGGNHLVRHQHPVVLRPRRGEDRPGARLAPGVRAGAGVFRHGEFRPAGQMSGEDHRRTLRLGLSALGRLGALQQSAGTGGTHDAAGAGPRGLSGLQPGEGRPDLLSKVRNVLRDRRPAVPERMSYKTGEQFSC